MASPPMSGSPAGEGTSCIGVGQQILSSCANERNDIEAYYSIASTTPASPQQIQQSIAALRGANLPTMPCCSSSATFVKAECQCDPTLAAILPSVGVAVTGLKSQLAILADACGNFVMTNC